MGGDEFALAMATEGRSRCFLCFGHVSRKFPEAQWKSGDPGFSTLQYLFRFLEMGKVTLNKSRLKAPMCAECAQLSEQFWRLCRKLEKIQMEVVSSLEHIYKRLLLQAGDELRRTDQFQKITDDNTSNPKDDVGMVETLGRTVEKLRKEAMERCFYKIRSLQPRVKVQRLARRRSGGKLDSNLLSQSFAIGKNFQKEGLLISADHNLERFNDSLSNHDTGNADFHQRCLITKEDSTKLFSSINTKTATNKKLLKKYLAPVCQVKMQDLFMKPFSSNLKPCKSEALEQEAAEVKNTQTNTQCPSEAVKNQATGEPPKKVQTSRDILNPKSRKYQCRHCSLEFKNQWMATKHYRSEHRNFNFKCDVCPKVFKYPESCDRHKRIGHQDGNQSTQQEGLSILPDRDLLKPPASSSIKTAKKEDSIQQTSSIKAKPNSDAIKPSSPINTTTKKHEDYYLKPSSSIKSATKEELLKKYDSCTFKMQDISKKLFGSNVKPPTAEQIKLRKQLFLKNQITIQKEKQIKKRLKAMLKEKGEAPKRPAEVISTHCQPEPVKNQKPSDPPKEKGEAPEKRPAKVSRAHCQPSPFKNQRPSDPPKQVSTAPKSIFNLKTGKYKCSHCSLEFKNTWNFTNHSKSEHLNFKYKCDLCRKVFKYQRSVLRHKTNLHEGARFKCDNCDHLFTHKIDLTQHQRLQNCTRKSSKSKSSFNASKASLSNDLSGGPNVDANPEHELYFIKQEVEIRCPPPQLIDAADDNNAGENYSELSNATKFHSVVSNPQLSSFHVKQEVSQHWDHENPGIDIDVGEIKLETPFYTSTNEWSSVDVDDI